MVAKKTPSCAATIASMACLFFAAKEQAVD
jgi:hypothetical protein